MAVQPEAHEDVKPVALSPSFSADDPTLAAPSRSPGPIQVFCPEGLGTRIQGYAGALATRMEESPGVCPAHHTAAPPKGCNMIEAKQKLIKENKAEDVSHLLDEEQLKDVVAGKEVLLIVAVILLVNVGGGSDELSRPRGRSVKA